MVILIYTSLIIHLVLHPISTIVEINCGDQLFPSISLLIIPTKISYSLNLSEVNYNANHNSVKKVFHVVK